MSGDQAEDMDSRRRRKKNIDNGRKGSRVKAREE
jgi:hypothetical protein